jgi:sugar phosphate isomerase/epimerase
MNVQYSFQLYSARNFLPWDPILAGLAKAGYQQVEGFGAVYANPAEFAGSLKKAGLTMPTGHFSLDALEKEFDKTVRTAKTLGMAALFCPYILPEQRPRDAAGWKAFAGRLAAIGAKLKETGLQFGWHNHDFEFRPMADGTLPMQAILDGAPGLSWEADIAWIVRGGADPSAWIEKHGKRILAVHVKDIAPAGHNKDEDGWADVGHGTVGWRGLMPLLRKRTAARWYVLEHDNPSDWRRFATRSIESLRQY